VIKTTWHIIKKSDRSHVIRVVFRDQRGMRNTIFCTVLFESTDLSKYRLKASWREDRVLNKADISDLSVTKVKRLLKGDT